MSDEKMINLNIDGMDVTVPDGTTILEAATKLNIDIPTLCYLKDINSIGACRMCIVEVEGARGFVTSCVYPVTEGMKVKTNTDAIREARKVTLELLLSNHDNNCITCSRSTNCELQNLTRKFDIKDIEFKGERKEYDVDEVSPSIVRDNNKCILCKRCVAVCNKVQNVGAINTLNRGFNSKIGTAFDKSIADVNCVNCGQCILACPTGALREKDNTDIVWEALKNPDLHVVVQTAPAVRVALGEEFGMDVGTSVTGKMVAGLKQLGFDKVFDTNTAADLTIMEEATELLDRINNGGVLPMITSCSPGWIKFIEHQYPELLQHLSTCKSPHQMFGAIIKSYYAEKENIDPKKIFVVSVMPCVAKKFEVKRKEMEVNEIRDVDVAITTRELARMLKQANIDLPTLKNEFFDNPMGQASGAGAIFGTSGGVMEAALRTAQDIIAGTSVDKIEFEDVRGFEGIKEATVKIGKNELKVAVAHGLGNATKIMDMIKEGKASYQFIEIMACPGGCITGGGQPIKTSKERATIDIWGLRAKAIYEEDKSLPIRKSHENPFIKKLYTEYLDNPGSHRAHELLHTHYEKRDII